MGNDAPIFADWIRVCEDPKHVNLFFLGAAETRITFYSQQVRALRLVHGLAQTGRLKTSDRVAVVGAGAAGVSAALALASFGARVDLIEQATDVLHLQSASPRLLHPHIYNWPAPGSLKPDAVLPFLDWTNATGAVVRNKLSSELHAAFVRESRLTFRKSNKLTEIARNGNQWSLTLAAPSDLATSWRSETRQQSITGRLRASAPLPSK
jgi:FAD dependent oxidoreductase